VRVREKENKRETPRASVGGNGERGRERLSFSKHDVVKKIKRERERERRMCLVSVSVRVRVCVYVKCRWAERERDVSEGDGRSPDVFREKHALEKKCDHIIKKIKKKGQRNGRKATARRRRSSLQMQVNVSGGSSVPAEHLSSVLSDGVYFSLHVGLTTASRAMSETPSNLAEFSTLGSSQTTWNKKMGKPPHNSE